VETECEVADIARAHDCGIVVEPGDREQMAAAIRRLHADQPSRARMAARARQAALMYDRRRAVEAYRNLFESVAS
jgi:glycosyltransferase involved in cell wall biosynthesis